jgi:hypothetical protein
MARPRKETMQDQHMIHELANEQEEIESLKSQVQEAKEAVKTKKEMVPWVRGIFNFTDQPGEVLSFIYNGKRLALKDKEKAEIPLEIANHLNSLKYDIVAWVREHKDEHEGQQGVKKVVGTKERCSFTIFDHFQMPKGTRIGYKPNERAMA